MQFGLKCWSNNQALCQQLRNPEIWQFYHFLELYVVPGTFESDAALWSDLPIPYFIIHAPHFAHGCNLSLAEHREANLKLMAESKRFLDLLKAKYLIVHLGTKGMIQESIRQLKEFENPNVLVENKPEVSLDGTYCVGTSPKEIQSVLDACDVGFCLDISHAIAYSAFHQLDYEMVLKEFIDLAPLHYHLCDGDVRHTVDKHLSIGKGNYDFKTIFQLLPQEAAITLETPKGVDASVPSLISEVKTLVSYESPR